MPRASFIVFPQKLSDGLDIALSGKKVLKDPQPQLTCAWGCLTSPPSAEAPSSLIQLVIWARVLTSVLKY